MVLINTVAALCLVCFIAIVMWIVLSVALKSAADRLKFIKSFKKGKATYLYFIAIPLYWTANITAGNTIFNALLMSMKSVVELLLLRFDVKTLMPVMQQSTFFAAVANICFVLVLLNAAFFSFTIFGQSLINRVRLFCIRRAHHNGIAREAKSVFVVFGYNKNNIQIVQSIDKSKSCALMVCDMTEAIKDELSILGCAYLPLKEGIVARIKSKLPQPQCASINVIVNTSDDAKNLLLTDEFCAWITAQDLKRFAVDDCAGLNVYSFGEACNASAFVRYAETSRGCIHYVNKYKLLATDFVNRYPLTKFMTEHELDTRTGLVHEGVDLNVVMIGFGKSNRELFLTSVANNQFMTEHAGVREEKPVNYFIFDKQNSENEKNLNHTLYRYLNEVKDQIEPSRAGQGEYLPLPYAPAKPIFRRLDINERGFYQSIFDALCASGKQGRTNYSYLVIAFGTDMENLDLAEKLSAKIKEWGLTTNVKLFVKIRDHRLFCTVQKQFAQSGDFIVVGDEKNTVYRVDRIIDEVLEKMAKRRHLTYTLEGSGSEAELKEKAAKKWFSVYRQIQRESNIYAVLSLRLKLNLLGYDYCPKGDARQDSKEDFYRDYTKGDPICYDQSTPAINGKRKILYQNKDQDKTSVRQMLAEQEHQRWNAYMIARGTIPMTKDEIFASSGGKQMEVRKHGCITTFKGLEEFRKIRAKAEGQSEEDTDVIRYDYQLMDDAAWLLEDNGYKIVRNNP